MSSTLRDLPQWSDPAVAEEAGFRCIRDAATGYEHYIQWDWINDDVVLDPDHPESLVYRVEPDGSRTLVSAMYMLPETTALADVPDWGGPLMQWHIHSDLCFDVSDPEQPRVGGLTDSAGECTAPLRKLAEAPMIHVWIMPHECGPFAALEGVAAGQVSPARNTSATRPRQHHLTDRSGRLRRWSTRRSSSGTPSGVEAQIDATPASALGAEHLDLVPRPDEAVDVVEHGLGLTGARRHDGESEAGSLPGSWRPTSEAEMPKRRRLVSTSDLTTWRLSFSEWACGRCSSTSSARTNISRSASSTRRSARR